MFFVSIGACIPLISKSTTAIELTATIIYSIGIFMMFGFSALYHRVNWRPKVLKIIRRLDHSSIFIMIAGTFTPICLLVIHKNVGIELIEIIGYITGSGIIQDFFISNMLNMFKDTFYLMYLILVILLIHLKFFNRINFIY